MPRKPTCAPSPPMRTTSRSARRRVCIPSATTRTTCTSCGPPRRFEGRRAVAVDAARKVAEKVPHHHAGALSWTADFPVTPLLAYARFGMWQEVLTEPKPPANQPYAIGIWHYGRGLAFVARGRLDAASSELAALEGVMKHEAFATTLKDLPLLTNLRIASRILDGELSLRRGNADAAVTALREAVTIEDGIPYSEPPIWHHPPRQILGAILLEAGRAAEAEAVYREDLKRFRENGWSLFGLARSLELQQRASEAAEARQRFEKAWARADIQLTSSLNSFARTGPGNHSPDDRVPTWQNGDALRRVAAKGPARDKYLRLRRSKEDFMALRINDVAPNFTAETTEGPINFHEWVGDGWAILFSHPKDFTPVCTTELGYMARIKPEFDKRNCKILGISVDGVSNHQKWSKDIETSQGHAVNYPLIGDPQLKVVKLYDMLPAEAGESSEGRTAADNATARSVFVIGPDKKVKATLTYPMSTGRNFDEILRLLDSCRLTAAGKVATPVNWKQGEDVIILPSVSDDDAKKTYPEGWKSPLPYMRVVPQPR